MNIPKIKRDETNTKIINKNELIKSIKYNSTTNILNDYKNALITQTKLDYKEVEDLINEIDKKIIFINKYKTNLNNNTLYNFYYENIYYLKDILDNISNELDEELLNVLISFLETVISNEEDGIINDYRLQDLFNEIVYSYKNNLINSDKLNNILNNIIERKERILNKKDINAMDYIEDDYLTKTQIINTEKINEMNNVSLPEEKINATGFIATSIILEGTLIATLIISLLKLFN